MSPNSLEQQPILECRGLSKTYTEGPQQVQVLQSIDLQVFPGDRLAIIGSSGSGKTTLLNLLAGLDVASEGQVLLAGQDLAQMKQKPRGLWRNQHLGFVYQFHHLLAELSALENVMLPLLIRGQSKAQAQAAAQPLLARVGLAARADHKPAELSGGERQRVALARALVGQPSCVLMDEPTGNLDQQTAAEVQSLIQELAEQSRIAFVLVTHDLQLAAQQHQIYQLNQGCLAAQSRP
ncbi:ABC transporter ATP-binding protein [Marinospirillum sp.]|uniref:ABC transporter ATP-binding protein n=1 Tax=Marinospirillum sp. TaxID=2183934 RepID=UPI003A89B22A